MSYYKTAAGSRTVLSIAFAAGGFILSWYLIHHGWYGRDKLWDTPEYFHYARQILARHLVPYRDFSVEYPPLALPVFVAPRVISQTFLGGYQVVFELGMLTCGVIAVGCAALIVSRQQFSTRRVAAAVALLAFSPLLLGAVLLSRYDLFPTMLTIAALAAIYFDWHRTGFALLALGAAAKAYPAVIVPIAAIYVWRNHGRRQAITCLAIFAAIVLVCFLPFLVIAPHGVWWSIHGQASRPPQIESLGASVFLAAHQLIGTHLSIYFTHGSDNINGHPALRFASVMSILELAALLLVVVFFARGPATKQRLLMGATAAVCAFIVFDRVLSPQYLIWLAPLVVTLSGRRGVAAMVMLACAMAMTQIWYPLHFTQLKLFEPLESWAVIARDLLLLALLGVLAWPDAPIWRSVRKAAREPGAGGQLSSARPLEEAG